MKLKLLPLCITLFAGSALAQTAEDYPIPPEIVSVNPIGQMVITTTNITCRSVTPSVHWNIIEDPENMPKKIREDGRKEFHMEGYEEALLKGDNDTPDPIVQTEMGSRQMRAPLVNFAVLSGSGV